MLAKLECLINELTELNTKLVLLVGPSFDEKSKLLKDLGLKLNCEPMNIGLELGKRLAATPKIKRTFSASEQLREVVESRQGQPVLLVDKLELLFDPSLNINPLDFLKRLAHSRRVIAVWPGALKGERLVYAERNHPEHRDYSRQSVVIFEI